MMASVGESERGHRILPHTADVILEAWGPDLAACGEEAVAALAASYVDDPASAPIVERLRVHLPPADDEELIVGLLDEVIFALDTAEGVPVAAEVASAPDGGFDVEIALADRGRVSGTGAVPKAISRSELRVDSTPGAVRCHVIVDV